MARAGSSPDDPGTTSTLSWAVPPVLVAVCSLAAVLLAPAPARLPVTWCGVAATVAVGIAAGEALRRGRLLAALRRRQAEQEAELRQRLADQEAETRRLARELLPAVVDRLQSGIRGKAALEGIDFRAPVVGQECAASHRRILLGVIDAVETEEGFRDAAQRAFVNIARRVQAIVHQQAQDLRELEDKHGRDPDVFGDLLHLDHGTALVGRLADSIAVLGGARPGRQWQQTVPLFNVLRGAMSRIMDYQRVDLHSVAEVGILGPTVEPLIHALSELLDNATRYSPPQTRVHLTATEVQSGVAVEIEDAGIGLTEEARERVESTLERASAGLDLDDLGEAPRLGLAVVGTLAQTNRFQISLRPSAYGGVRAVLVVPQDKTTTTPAPGGRIARAASLPPPRSRKRTGPVATHPAADRPADPEIPVERNANGLPQRRRRMPSVTERIGRTPVVAAAQPEPDPRPRQPAEDRADGGTVQPGIWLAAFQSGISGDGPPHADSPHSDQSTAKDE